MIHSLIEYAYCVEFWFTKLKVHFFYQAKHLKILNNQEWENRQLIVPIVQKNGKSKTNNNLYNG
jgi:hypothetical protein